MEKKYTKVQVGKIDLDTKKNCESLVLRPEWVQNKLSMLLVCEIPAYQDADTTFCDEWRLERGEIVPRDPQKEEGGLTEKPDLPPLNLILKSS